MLHLTGIPYSSIPEFLQDYCLLQVVSYDQDEYDRSLSKVDLDFVDYGDSEVKGISEVFEIRPEYLKLKFQAIPCSLAHIR